MVFRSESLSAVTPVEYKPNRRGRKPLNRKCEVPGCDRKHLSKGLCRVHYDAQPSMVAKRAERIRNLPKAQRQKVSREYRMRLKLDPERYQKHRAYIREYQKTYVRSPEQVARYRERARIYSAKWWNSLTPEQKRDLNRRRYLKRRSDPEKWNKYKEKMRKYMASRRNKSNQ